MKNKSMAMCISHIDMRTQTTKNMFLVNKKEITMELIYNEISCPLLIVILGNTCVSHPWALLSGKLNRIKRKGKEKNCSIRKLTLNEED